MLRRTFVKIVAAAMTGLVARTSAFAQTDPGTPTEPSGGTDMANTAPQTGYAPVNGLQMYYEIHGSTARIASASGVAPSASTFARRWRSFCAIRWPRSGVSR